jgi:DNA repair protein RadA/Sms
VAIAEMVIGDEPRLSLGVSEFDRVLGGGVVPGSLILMGGDPGIGKSTLVLQAASTVATESTVLYVSAEESAGQVKMRADRLGLDARRLMVMPETSLDAALRQAIRFKRCSAKRQGIRRGALRNCGSAPAR